jgi:hypothetical protein
MIRPLKLHGFLRHAAFARAALTLQPDNIAA